MTSSSQVVKIFFKAFVFLILPFSGLTFEVKNLSKIKLPTKAEEFYFIPSGGRGEIIVSGPCELQFTFIKLIKEDDLMTRGIYFITMIIDEASKKTYQIPFDRSDEVIKGKEVFYLSTPKTITLNIFEGEHRIAIETGKRFEGRGVLFSLRRFEKKVMLPEKMEEPEKIYDVRKRLFLIGGYGSYAFGLGDSYISTPSGGIELGACPTKLEGRFCLGMRFDYAGGSEKEERNGYIAKGKLNLYRFLIMFSYRELIGDAFIFELFLGGGFYPAHFSYSYEPPIVKGKGTIYPAWAFAGGGGIGFSAGPGEIKASLLLIHSTMLKDEKVEGDFLGTLNLSIGYNFRL